MQENVHVISSYFTLPIFSNVLLSWGREEGGTFIKSYENVVKVKGR